MTQTAIATKIHQALDAHADFTAQITFNDKFGNFVTQRVDLFFRQLTDLNIFSDTRCSQDGLERSCRHRRSKLTRSRRVSDQEC